MGYSFRPRLYRFDWVVVFAPLRPWQKILPLQRQFRLVLVFYPYGLLVNGCGGWIRTTDLKLMRLPGTARLPYSAIISA